ncbi:MULTISPECIES: hypothetical protein [Streptomycetaceae]|uniref:hypothetical protein n=1 Tax=Streptomycetaceae TaxID=2062 RepID=UPI000213D2E0|nr:MULTISPECIES: hypothetical protein [Streptomycetaceae]MYS59911.1 hypothetical protein [Streptomyces sp. SID5468]CCB75677.1 conserved protein of unknown function [Streptantibioticus cattleyicolor NRRL 8057 = DSM 46488]
MADYPPNQGPNQGQAYDPAGSTQMFRAFVDEGAERAPAAGAATTYGTSRGPRTGLIVGIVLAVVVVAVVAYLAL